MNSKDLLKMDFATWCGALQLQKEDVPRMGGVYVLRLLEPITRLRGRSDLLYIGHASDLGHRIVTEHIRGKGLRKGGTSHRIHQYLDKGKYDKRVQISWKRRVEHRDFERGLLKKYEADHHELPPWNRQI